MRKILLTATILAASSDFALSATFIRCTRAIREGGRRLNERRKNGTSRRTEPRPQHPFRAFMLSMKLRPLRRVVETVARPSQARSDAL